jgi:hypothetical protein
LREFRKEIFGEVSELRKELITRFYWLIGVPVSMWITIIVTVLLRVH